MSFLTKVNFYHFASVSELFAHDNLMLVSLRGRWAFYFSLAISVSSGWHQISNRAVDDASVDILGKILHYIIDLLKSHIN